eukprot:4187142-Pyramimonas_sp.AAC.1
MWGVPTCVTGTHVVTATEAFGGALCGASKRESGGHARGHSHGGLRWSSLWGLETCEGCADFGWRGRMWSQPLRPSLELPLAPRNV